MSAAPQPIPLYPVILTHAATRAWLAGHGLDYVRLPRSLDEPYVLSTPDGAWYTVQALITGGYRIETYTPPAGGAEATVWCPACGRPLRTAHSDPTHWACVSCDRGYAKGTLEPLDGADDAQAAHEADDPHCTCNDCILSHAARLADPDPDAACDHCGRRLGTCGNCGQLVCFECHDRDVCRMGQDDGQETPP